MNNKLAKNIKLRKWNNSFIRDKWGNLTNCFWNKMAKEEILKIEKSILIEE